MNKLQTLEAKLVELKSELEASENTLASYNDDPLTHFENEITEAYDNMLEEKYCDALNTLDFISCSAAEVMKIHDECRYRTGLNDYADSFDISGLTKYTETEERIEELKDSIIELEDEIIEIDTCTK